MKTLPKVHYVLGEALDLSDMVVMVGQGSSAREIAYSSFSSEGIVCEPDNGTVLTFDNESFIIRNTNTGKGITQSIDVTNDIASMIVKTNPVSEYFTGESLDLEGMVIEATLENGDKEDIPFGEFGESFNVTPGNGDILSPEHSVVSITHIATGENTILSISVVDFVPTSGVVISEPLKTSYEVGERLNLDGLNVKYETTAGISKEVASANFSLYGISTVPAADERVGSSVSAISILHEASGVNISTNIEVTPLKVVGMTVKFKPDKTLYVEGENIDHSGLVITLSVEGGNEIDVVAQDFDIYGIIAVPENGIPWESSMTEIVISYPGYAETISIPLGSEVIYESDFTADGTAGWGANQNGGGSVNLLVEDGNLVAKDIVLGANTWDVQLYYPNLTIESGVKYKYQIIIKKQDPSIPDYWLNLSLGDGDGRDGWGAYDGGNGVWFSGDGWHTVEKEFVMPNATTDAARLLFDIGTDGYGIVIQSVKIEKL